MTRKLTIVCAVVTCGVWALPAAAAQVVYPTKDGTLVDGGPYGPLDGVADAWDWTFNDTGYEGSITLTTGVRALAMDRRAVWEYDLSGVTFAPPVSATLSFTIRGAPVFPFPDVDMHVYAYPADLDETSDDFASGPTVFQGSATVIPYQAPTEYTLNVYAVVDQALLSGADMVAFRFQIDPNSPYDSNQAFIDALDSNPTTKPYLTIDAWAGVAGDFDRNGVVDLADHAAFADCMAGPDAPPSPLDAAVTSQMCLDAFDSGGDNDVDLDDFAVLEAYLTGGSG